MKEGGLYFYYRQYSPLMSKKRCLSSQNKAILDRKADMGGTPHAPLGSQDIKNSLRSNKSESAPLT
jgi:hypothetical protein